MLEPTEAQDTAGINLSLPATGQGRAAGSLATMSTIGPAECLPLAAPVRMLEGVMHLQHAKSAILAFFTIGSFVFGWAPRVAAQGAPIAPTIIACEGPTMPAACPPIANSPRTLDDARRELEFRQAGEEQQLLLARQRIGLKQQLHQDRADSMQRYNAAQPPSLLAPPNFGAAEGLLSGIVNGVPR